jgi:vanillate/3-O-methylgallate O-demethylase
MLRNSQIGAYVYPVVPPEYTNWRDEQRAWRETCVLFDQSHHMADIYIEGPDALKLLSDLAINSFKNFTVNKAKQFVPCSYDGYVIGDVILFHLEQNRFNLVGRPSFGNWVQFHAETGGYDVKLDRDDRAVAPRRQAGRAQALPLSDPGPERRAVMEKLNGGRSPRSSSSTWTRSRSPAAGSAGAAARHGRRAGLESWGPYEDGEAVRAAIVEAGKEFGLHQVGSRAYATNTLESGWIPSPLPAVYTGDEMKPYREVARRDGYEARLARRQLLFEQHRGLLPDAVGSRLRLVRQVRPRLHRP